MRDLFGCDCVWRPRCDKELEGYLSNTPCKVQPEFVSPEQDWEHNTLTPIPRWRMAFMRQNHLWNNWRQGKYVEEEIKNQHSEDSKYGPMCHIFQTNDFIIALWKNKMEVLDVKEFPAADATESVDFATEFDYNLQINTENDILVTLYKSGVQVYHLNFTLRQCSLKHTFFFEESSKLIYSFKDLKSIFYARKVQRSYKAVRVVVGNYFVGVLEGNSTLHIWDLNTGLKIKEQTCPIQRCTIINIKASSSKHLVVSLKHNGQNSNSFLTYSLTKLAYLTFKQNFQGECQFEIHGDYVGIWNNNMLQVYNCLTSQVLLQDHPAQPHPSCTEDHVIFPCYKGVLNNFLFIENETLKMFDSENRNIVSLPFPEVMWFEVLSNRFLQVRTCEGFEIWEFKGMFENLKKTSMDLYFPACKHFLNRASTRYIVRYGSVGSVLHFW